MLSTLLVIVCLLGFIFASQRYLQLPGFVAPLFGVTSLCLLQFLSAMTHSLWLGTLLILLGGLTLFIFITIQAVRYRQLTIYFNHLTLIFVGLLLISNLLSNSLLYRVIDEYSFWGALSKLIFLENRLPDSNTVLYPRHLTYTPGLALFHYFVYQFYGVFSESISYFAQSILTIAALLAVSHQRQTSTTVISIVALALLMNFFFGSILTKLTADYLLALYFFAGLWIWFGQQKLSTRLLCILPLIPTLFLMKEIGLFFGVLLAIIVSVDSIQQYWNIHRSKVFLILAGLALSLILLSLLKLSWTAYGQAQNFQAFHQNMDLYSVGQALNLSSVQTWMTLKLFLSHLLFDKAERILNTPYIFWYGLVILLWVGIFKRLQTSHDRQRYYLLLGSLSIGFAIYILLIYLLQVVVFKLGVDFDQALSFSRYTNIYFSTIVIFSIYRYLSLVNVKFSPLSTSTIATVLTISFLSFMFVNKLRLLDKIQIHEVAIKQQAEQILLAIEPSIASNICIISDKDYNQGFIKLRFLFYLLPQRSNYTDLPTDDATQLFQQLLACDYLFIHWAQQTTLTALNRATLQPHDYAPGTIYQINHTPTLALTRIMIYE